MTSSGLRLPGVRDKDLAVAEDLDQRLPELLAVFGRAVGLQGIGEERG